MLAFLFALFLSAAHAQPDYVDYHPGNQGTSALPIEKGSGVVRLFGASQYQLTDRVQLRSSLPANLFIPNMSVLIDLGSVGERGHLAVEPFAGIVLPWFRSIGFAGGVLGRYTHTTRNFRPDYINLSAGMGIGGVLGFNGNGVVGGIPLLATVEWDHRLNGWSRLQLGTLFTTLASPNGGAFLLGYYGRYVHLLGAWRVGGGLSWSAPMVTFSGSGADVGVSLPYPFLELALKF